MKLSTSERARHPSFGAADNRFPATQFVVSNQKQIAVRSGRASGPLSHACGLQMSVSGSQLRKIMTSVTHSRTRLRVCVTPSFRDGGTPSPINRALAPFALTAGQRGKGGGGAEGSGNHAFFRNFRTFPAVRLIAASDTRDLRVCTRVHDRIALRCHDSHSPSFSMHPLHPRARAHAGGEFSHFSA